MDARAFLRQNIVIDGHLDLLCDVLYQHRRGRRRVILDDYMPDWRAGGVDCVVSSLYCDEGCDYLSEALRQIAAFEDELAESGGEFFLATRGADIRRAHATGAVAIMLSFEGVEPLSGEVNFMRLFHRLGVRFAGLCWSRANWAADGSRFGDAGYAGTGLTEPGGRLLELMRELRVLPDVSHINDTGFWQVLECAKQPVIASHSNCRAISDITRNIDDRQIAAIAKSGGVIGVNGVSMIARADTQAAADMNTLIRHMLHIKKVAGAQCLAIGLDQCDRLKPDAHTTVDSDSFDIIPRYAQLAEFVEAVSQADFTEEEIRGFLGANLLRVIESAIG